MHDPRHEHRVTRQDNATVIVALPNSEASTGELDGSRHSHAALSAVR